MNINKINAFREPQQVAGIVLAYKRTFDNKTEEQIASEFNEDMDKVGAVCMAATLNEQVVGFAWGYQMEIRPEIDRELKAPGLHYSVQGKFFYLKKMAVLPEFQKKGIGKLMLNLLIMELADKQLMLKVKSLSPMDRLISQLKAYIAVPLADGRMLKKIVL